MHFHGAFVIKSLALMRHEMAISQPCRGPAGCKTIAWIFCTCQIVCGRDLIVEG